MPAGSPWSRVAISLCLIAGCRTEPTKPPQPQPEPDQVAQVQPDQTAEPPQTQPETGEDTPAGDPTDPTPETQAPELPEQPQQADPPAQPDPEPPVDPKLAHCPDFGDEPFVYAIGSSTLASLLGPMIEQTVKTRWPHARVRKWGKASSGLARPDFHDWAKEMPSVNEEYDPDIYIVNLGTNDFQSVWLPDGWAKAHTPEWEKAYGDRVDALLEVLSGERNRLIVWVGPSAFPAKNARQIGPKVNRVIKQRIKAFAGNAFYVDAFTKTSPKRGQYIKTVNLNGKEVAAYGPDGVHLSNAAVKVLMSRPLFKIVGPCLKAAAPTS